jgi:hypothetical protein
VIRLGREFGAASPAVIRSGVGPQQSVNGEAYLRAISALAILGGHWSKTGGGLFAEAYPEFDIGAAAGSDLVKGDPRQLDIARLGPNLADPALSPPLKGLMVWNMNPVVALPEWSVAQMVSGCLRGIGVRIARTHNQGAPVGASRRRTPRAASRAGETRQSFVRRATRRRPRTAKPSGAPSVSTDKPPLGSEVEISSLRRALTMLHSQHEVGVGGTSYRSRHRARRLRRRVYRCPRPCSVLPYDPPGRGVLAETRPSGRSCRRRHRRWGRSVDTGPAHADSSGARRPSAGPSGRANRCCDVLSSSHGCSTFAVSDH